MLPRSSWHIVEVAAAICLPGSTRYIRAACLRRRELLRITRRPKVVLIVFTAEIEGELNTERDDKLRLFITVAEDTDANVSEFCSEFSRCFVVYLSWE